MQRKTLTIAAAVLMSTTLVACSSTKTNSSASSLTSSAGPTSSSSAAAGSVSAAAQKYLGLTTQTNTDLTAFLTLPDATPAAQVQAASAKVATDETALVQSLKQQQWPAAIQPEVTNLEAELGKEQQVYRQAAAAPTVAAIKAVLQQDQATIAARAAASTQLKAALGLPVTGTSAAPTSARTTTAS